MSRPGPRRFINPTLLAFIVAGGITAGLAYMVLSAGSSLMPERPDPVGTAISAPTEQAMTTVEPTLSPAQTPVPTADTLEELARVGNDEQPEAPAPNAPPSAVPTQDAAEPTPPPVSTEPVPTPTPRVVNVTVPTAPPDPAPTEAPAPTEEPAETVAPAPTQAPAPTSAPAMAAAPTPAVEIIQLPPVDQAAPAVAPAAAPETSQETAIQAPTQAPAVIQPGQPSTAGSAPSSSETGQPASSNGRGQSGATELLFPTSVAGNPGNPGNPVPGSATGSGPGVVGGPTQVATSLTPTPGAAPAMPTQVADQPSTDPEIASSATSRNQERTEELRECIEDRAQGRNRNRGRNRDRDNQNQNQDQDNQGSCGNQGLEMAGNPAANPAANPADEMADQIGQEIRDDVNERLKAAGIDRDD